MRFSPRRSGWLACVPLTLAFACGGDGGGGDHDDQVDGGGGDDGGGGPDAFVGDCDPVSGTTVRFELVTADVDSPVFVTAPPGDPTRLFVVEQAGTIKLIKDGALLGTPFLDISDDVTFDPGGGEQGLLGLAFHPDYSSNGRFFVYYTSTEAGEPNRVSEFTRSGADPDVAGTAETIVLEMADIDTNHNGGMIAFDSEGYLYIGTGDGGGSDDPQNNGQKITTPLGKMLRIDVDDGDPYGIPTDNPLFNSITANVRKEIWHIGLRNPWRWSFDRSNGDLWIGDVGQGTTEEIDHVPGNAGGKNFGWSDKEGDDCYEADPCAAPDDTELTATFTDPVTVYANPAGNVQAAVAGGYVYRGSCYPDIQGWYFFADSYSDDISAIDTSVTPFDDVDVTPAEGGVEFIVSFGEDAAGELYVVSLTEGVYRLRAGN